MGPSNKSSNRKYLYLILPCFLMIFVFLGCNRTYSPSAPAHPTPTPTATLTVTPTITPTYVSTPGCGFTLLTIPTPVTAPVDTTPSYAVPGPVPGVDYVVRNLSDWQNYFGSTAAPAPPVDFSSQMILINEQAYTFNPLIGVGFGTGPVSVCWTNSEVTVSCNYFSGQSLYPIQITPVPDVTQYFIIGLSVPISSLPVTWVYTTGIYAI